ncbi:MAG TPA: STAS/SEC14 domain-containing protein [Gemmatimonadaceae bacterium]
MEHKSRYYFDKGEPMLDQLNDLPAGLEGVKASGRVSKDDYERVLEPMIDAARRDGRRLRFIYQFGPEFVGFTPGAAWEDVKVGLRSLRLFDACAIVTDVGWIRETARLAGFMMPCPVKVFSNGERDAAVEWLRLLPETSGVATRLDAERGVMVVEVTRSLQAQDFDALALMADPWIEAHGRLAGLVIHAREFPGWQNLGALVRHVRFVRDHHRAIERVALATDGKIASLAPRIGEHFVRAQLKTFAYEDVDRAIAWASGATTTGA